MGRNPVDEELARQAVDALALYGTQTKAADALGITVNTLAGRVRSAAKRGLCGTDPVLPGFNIIKTTAVRDKDGNLVREFIQQKPETGETEFEVPPGHHINAESALVDSNGHVIHKWVKTKKGVFDPLQIAELLKGAFADVKPAEAVQPPAMTYSELLTLVPCNDWHLNMYAWGKETEENWDLPIAERVIGAAVESVIERSHPTGTCVVLGGGDLLHINGKNNTTASGTPLDADDRYQRGVEVGGRLMVRTVDAALRRHGTVVVRVLRGNHDEDSSVALAYFLLAWYRNEPRVHVDVDPSLFWWYRFGKVMLGATHGHTVRIERMPSIMAHRRAEDWGATKYRYIHGFHLHHVSKYVTEGEGVISEVHQAPVPKDAWHFNSGYLSGRSLHAITYHCDFGEVGRVRAAIIDAK